jgi:two-component system, cell cycle sensor histidine kinase and response regulator CckA
LFDKVDDMVKAPGTSAGITEIPEQTEEQHPITHHDVADMPAEDLRQLLHELQIRQTKLEAQNEKLRRARAEGYKFSPAGQLTLDTLGKIVEANLRAATLVGIDRDKLIGQPFIRFVAQDSQDIFHWHCRRVLKTGTRQTCEMQLQKKSGAPHWVHLESLAVDRESGPVTHWQTVLLDISEQKRTEGALRLAKFSMERAADAVYWIDQQARILDVNEAASLMLGYSKDELCVMTIHDLNPDFQKEQWLEFWAETQRCGTMVLETVHQAKNGRLIPIEVSVNYLFYEGKEYHCAFVRDITERKRADAALRASEEQYRALYDDTPTMYFKLATDGTVRSVNRFGATQLGYRVEELIGHSVLNLFHECDKEAVLASLSECLATPEATRHWEFRKVRKDGSIISVREAARVGRSSTGEAVVLVTCEDITERKRAEEELQRSQAFITSVVENLPNMIFVKDAKDLKFVRVNKASEDLLGHSREVLIGKSDYDLFRKEEADFFTKKDRQVLESGRLLDIPEEPIETKDQGLRILHTKKIPICDDKGEPQYLLGISEDITDRKQAEEALGASERLMNNILENIPSYVFATDRQHHYILLSDDLAKFYGKRKEEILGKTHHSVFPEKVADAIQATNEQIMTSGIAQQLEEVVESPVSGIPRILSTNKSPLRDEKGQIYGISGIATDITEHKRLETQFRQAQKMDAIGRLAGGVAHDFNNLLTIINGYSAMLIERLAQEDPKHEMAVETLKAGERASELTKQLLAFSRKQVLMPQPLNFNDSLRLISSMLNRLLGEQITLTMDLAPDLWLINGDKGQLNQVTLNLVINARDAMPNGGTLTIATRNLSVTPEWLDHHQMMPQGDYVHMSVHDTGHGMSPETLSHLFEPFFTTKEVGQGTGLGLATVYGIVKQSQGYIFTDSALDQGTTFHLYYPRVIAAAAVAPTPPIRHKKGSEHLLIVEDQDSVRALIVEALKQDGYRVIEAASGEDALRKVSSLSEPIQALITDVIMPHMSGLVLAERLRVTCPNIRVLFMSGYVDPSQSAFLDEPTAAFIQKPFLPDDLARHLRNLLDKSIVRER